MTDDFAGNIERFSGFAGLYDRYRPAPPAILASILLDLAQASRPNCVVDLGCGTGLSTRYWADLAGEVIGVDPSADMLGQAQEQTRAANLHYREGLSHATGLPDGCAQIVTCSQSLHWMDPQPTFLEARRILQSGGVFAAFDYDWPPTVGSWEAEAAYNEVMQRVLTLLKGVKSELPVKQWEKDGHLARMTSSGCFRYTKEIVLHQVDRGNAERLVGLLRSQGSVMTLLKNGTPENQIGIDRLADVADQTLGASDRPWVWSSRVRLGIV
jgi:SAM-dependent methyltransferase